MSEDCFRDNIHTWWRLLFNVGKVETSQRKFAGEILTDGKAVSVLLARPGAAIVDDDGIADPRQYRGIILDDYSTVWGVDPGVRDLFHATSSDGRHLRYSSRQWYHVIYSDYSSRKISRWQKRDCFVRDSYANMPAVRGTDIRPYITYVLPLMDRLLRFAADSPMRDLRFKRYVARQRALRAICKAFKDPGQRVLIGYGDWGTTATASIIKKNRPGPVKQLYRALCNEDGVQAKYVCEFRTSKLCRRCHLPLQNMKVPGLGEHPASEVYSVLHCHNSECSSFTVNRDVNASGNILDVFVSEILYGRRLLAFQRPDRLFP